MSASEWYLLLSLFGAAWTAAAWFGVRHAGPAVPIYFFMSWLCGELAMFHVAWQAVATVLFAAFGGLEGAAGAGGLAISFGSWSLLFALQRRSELAGPAFGRALANGLGESFRLDIPADRRALLREDVRRADWLRPFSFHRPGVQVVRDIEYGPAGRRHHLDVYRPRADIRDAPVLLQIHGGAWTIGAKEQQGQPLMQHLAERGWVCVAANYRLSPRVRFPEHLIDVKRALAWTRRHIADHGGSPEFIAATGGSAGGHLCSLLALSANEPEFQPGFEEVDTSLAAAVPFYGIYDFTDREGVRGRSPMVPMLERVVMPAPLAKDPDMWRKASPIDWVREDAPPFLVIHGSHDALAFVEDARLFVAALRAVSKSPVVYAEIPYAQHAFDIFHSVRSAHAVDAVTQFLEWVRATRARAGRSAAASSPEERPGS